MASYFTILLIGISLSMDTFSLSLAYGMLGISKRYKLILSLVVGAYHFIMPIIGLIIGSIIDKHTFINLHLIASIILIYIGINLITSKNKNETLSLSKIGLLLFVFSVSIDSLTVGIGLRGITNKYFLSAITFSICSAFFTYLGLFLGNSIGNKLGIYSKITGGIILIIIAIIMFVK